MSKRGVGLAGCRKREVSGWMAGPVGPVEGAWGGTADRGLVQPTVPGNMSQNYLSLPSSSLCKSLVGLAPASRGALPTPDESSLGPKLDPWDRFRKTKAGWPGSDPPHSPP